MAPRATTLAREPVRVYFAGALGTPRAGWLPMKDAMHRCISLAELGPGQRARLCEHPRRRPVAVRLEELGFVPGTVVEILRRAPLGDPVEVELRGYRVCLRLADIADLCAMPDGARR